jgi:hypothetical protein
MQNMVRDEFGLEGSAGWRPDRITDSEVAAIGQVHGPALRSFARAQYDATQADLAARGITEVTVYRGTGVQGVSEGSVTLRPASSWSSDPSTAREFAATAADQDGNAAVLAATVPASRVLSTPSTGVGCLSEDEVVLLGGTLDVEVDLRWD